MFNESKTSECLHHEETPFNQSTEAIQMSLANTSKILIKIANTLNISIKIAVLDMQAKVIHSDTKPDNFLPDHHNENIEGRIKKINEQSNWLQYRKGFLIWLPKWQQTFFVNNKYMYKQINNMNKETVELINKHGV